MAEPPCPITTTSFTPAVPAGVVQVAVVAEVICILVQSLYPSVVLPSWILTIESKFVPVIVMVSPPAVDPVFGLTLVIVGASASSVIAV